MNMCVNKFDKRYDVKLTTNFKGKMMGMVGVTTSCLDNKYCEMYRNIPGSVCQKCYAERALEYMKNPRERYEKNGKSLKGGIIPYDALPELNCLYFRFESHGDLENEIQLINYIHICEKNPNTRFALWTKNGFIVDEYFKSGGKKPKNLNIVYSSLFLNQEADIKDYDWIDVLFTVYDKEFAQNNNVEINCGAKNCFGCAKCYKKHKGLVRINEQLK